MAFRGPATWGEHPRCFLASVGMRSIGAVPSDNEVFDMVCSPTRRAGSRRHAGVGRSHSEPSTGAGGVLLPAEVRMHVAAAEGETTDRELGGFRVRELSWHRRMAVERARVRHWSSASLRIIAAALTRGHHSNRMGRWHPKTLRGMLASTTPNTDLPRGN